MDSVRCSVLDGYLRSTEAHAALVVAAAERSACCSQGLACGTEGLRLSWLWELGCCCLMDSCGPAQPATGPPAPKPIAPAPAAAHPAAAQVGPSSSNGLQPALTPEPLGHNQPVLAALLRLPCACSPATPPLRPVAQPPLTSNDHMLRQ
jgi:hypothetical protein